MGLFDGYSDLSPWPDSGGLLARLLALQKEQDQYQPDGEFNSQDSAGNTPSPSIVPSISWPTPSVNSLLPAANALGDHQMPIGAPVTTPDLNSQYQALRPILGDHQAMIATVHPETGSALIARALANGPASGDTGGTVVGYQPVISDADPEPIHPGAQYAQAPALCVAGPMGCAVGAGLTLGQVLFGGAALIGSGALILHNKPSDQPPSGSRGINETEWSGDHGQIKKAVEAGGSDKINISPTGDVWAQKPDGSWENHGPASSFTGSGKPSGRRGRDRNRWH